MFVPRELLKSCGGTNPPALKRTSTHSEHGPKGPFFHRGRSSTRYKGTAILNSNFETTQTYPITNLPNLSDPLTKSVTCQRARSPAKRSSWAACWPAEFSCAD